jgi:hypothetical protein
MAGASCRCYAFLFPLWLRHRFHKSRAMDNCRAERLGRNSYGRFYRAYGTWQIWKCSLRCSRAAIYFRRADYVIYPARTDIDWRIHWKAIEPNA